VTVFAQIDAFSPTPFAGNPAAVLLLAEPAADEWMAAVARETNLPATAFVHEAGDGFGIRWFTATTELHLCGHGTLASAHLLYETGRVPAGDAIRFQSPNGPLSATAADGWIELNFPAIPEKPIETPPGLADALGTEILYVGRGRLDCIVEVADEATVRDLRPDVARLRDVDARGVIVTSRATTPGCDFVSRFFAPSTGINEDFVTGSAHCCLAPFWAQRLGKASMTAHQLSARGGVLKVTMDGDRVRLAGQAVTVIRGEFARPSRP
jgi:PhzF family phenazine biosynthesis protein